MRSTTVLITVTNDGKLEYYLIISSIDCRADNSELIFYIVYIIGLVLVHVNKNRVTEWSRSWILYLCGTAQVLPRHFVVQISPLMCFTDFQNYMKSIVVHQARDSLSGPEQYR